jgi:integrase
MIIPTLTFKFDRRGRASRTNPASVELEVYVDRKKRKYINTGVKLYPKEWRKSTGEVNSCRSDYLELNDQLQAFKRKTLELVTKMIEDGNFDLNALPSMLEAEITQQDTFIAYAKEMAKRRFRKISDGTKKHYKVFFDFLERWKGIVYFSDVTERSILKMDDTLERKGLKECTRWNYHKMMKSFILQAMDDGLVKKNPYSRLDIKRGNESGLTRFLTPAEFHRFESAIIPIARLQRVRDLFVFQTYTMMSYSDMEAFNYKNCVEVDGEVVYKAKRRKTGQEFTILLLKPALYILKRYKNRLPMISNVKYNEYLKAAVLYAKIDKPVTTHWARHTGATMLLNEGNIPMHIVQHILGHATIRETERTYAKVMDKTIVETLVSYQKEKFG